MIRRYLFFVFFLSSMAAFAAHSGPVKVACVGNSITYGYKVENRETNNYPAQLGKMLGEGYEVGNFGRSSATLLSKGHFPYVAQPEYQAALEFKPDIVVIHLGVNDTDPRDWPNWNAYFVTDYIRLINSFREANPAVRVIIARLSPLGASHYRFKSGTREWRDEVQNAIETVAEIAGVELIDFAAPLRDHQYLIPDAVHPNAEGASLLARTVYGAITGDYGGLRMSPVYTSGMVLQRFKPLAIKGHADAGSRIVVTLSGNEATAVADNLGNWTATLRPMAEATGLTMTVSDGKSTLRYDDVAVGEVWMASGQSNMEFLLRNATTAAADIPAAQDAELRFFDMKARYVTNSFLWSKSELDSVNHLAYYKPARWVKSEPATAANFSAVAYYFGKMLRDSLNVPVGIICNAVGGSPTESWVDIETLEHGLPEILLNWRKNDYLQDWVKGRITENVGAVGQSPQRHPYEPSYLFASGIRPLDAYPVAGVIWYQGESNAHNIEVHEVLFKLLVESWRNYWDNASLPFYFVQLSSLSRPSWPQFRDSQRRLMESMPNTGMAVTSDVGDSLDVHPRSKQAVGQRLARWALNKTYSMGHIAPSGPLPVKAERSGNAVLVTMEYADDMHSSDGRQLATFEIAEYDGLYYPATAEITNDNQIKLTNMNVKNPRYARYAWQPFTRANLVNGDNLPASTFKLEVKETPDREKGIASGVSACFAGMSDGFIVSAGGCNFPENPLASDSKKKFYQAVYVARPDESASLQWTKAGELPEPMAYGASATTRRGIVVVGGTTATIALDKVWLIAVADARAVVSPLPSLPFAMDNMSACAIDDKVYVAGGNKNGAPCNELLCLDLNEPDEGWKSLPPFPGNPRVQPVVAAGKNAKGEMCVYLWGGFAGKGSGREASLETDGCVYSPSKKKWMTLGGPVDEDGEKISVGGGAACTLPNGKIVVVGGVNKDVFLEALRNQAPDYLSHPIEWYRFNDKVLVFDPADNSWGVSMRDKELARAGAAVVVASDGSVYVIGGELKPRIRTPYVSRIVVQ